MGCTDPSLEGEVDAPHQCPLGLVARDLIYADARTFRCLITFLKVRGALRRLEPAVRDREDECWGRDADASRCGRHAKRALQRTRRL